MVSKSGFRSAKLSYSGSAVVSYSLVDKTGVIKSSGVLDHTKVKVAKRGNGLSNLGD